MRRREIFESSKVEVLRSAQDDSGNLVILNEVTPGRGQADLDASVSKNSRTPSAPPRLRCSALALIAACVFGSGATEAQFMTGLRVDKERNAQQAALSSRDLVERVGFDQRLGEPLPLDAAFHDETGRAVRLGDFFGEKPVVLALVYYRCPLLCTLIERGLARGLKPLQLMPGREFDVVFVSFDPEDTPATARERKAATLAAYGHEETAHGWHFLSGDAAAIAAVTGAVGFRYTVDPSNGQFAHASGAVVATPGGKISRYLFGAEFAPRDLKLALVESSEGKIGGTIEKLMLVCFQYNAALGKYTAVTMLALRIVATATLAAVGLFLFVSLRRERRQRLLVARGAV